MKLYLGYKALRQEGFDTDQFNPFILNIPKDGISPLVRGRYQMSNIMKTASVTCMESVVSPWDGASDLVRHLLQGGMKTSPEM